MMNLVVAAAALAAASPQAPPDKSPAMFVVRDADTTVYVFGTFHALDGNTDWFNSQVRAAFEQSGELILETVVPEAPIARPGFRGVHPRQFNGLPVAPSASFLATTRMAISAGKSQGMSVDNGADMVLRRAAEMTGKQVQGLETLESQLAMFTRMPAPAQVAPRAGAPVEAARPMESLSRAMADMQAAWKRGDQSVFVHMLGQLEQSSPDTYRMMFTERNQRWADWVAGRMQTPGVVFVAVGAGHLAGKDSLLVRLAQQGIPSTRLN